MTKTLEMLEAERLLVASGAVVSWPKETLEMVRPVDFFRAHVAGPEWIDITYDGFLQRLRAGNCPPSPRKKGPRGKLLKFTPTPLVVAFLTAPAHRGVYA